MGVREPTKVVRSWTTDSRRWASYKPRAGEDDITLWKARVGRELSPALARWLTSRRRIAGEPRQQED